MTNQTPTRIRTGRARFSYLNVFTPRAFGDGEPKYSVTLLIPKSDKATYAKINAAIDAAKKAWVQSGKKLPANPKTTLHDGDGTRANSGEEFGEECKGHWVITVSSKNPPTVVYSDKTPILDPQQIKSGDYGYAIINFYVYDYNGTKGVSAGLNGIMKLEDGEALGGSHISDEDWEDPDDADDLLS